MKIFRVKNVSYVYIYEEPCYNYIYETFLCEIFLTLYIPWTRQTVSRFEVLSYRIAETLADSLACSRSIKIAGVQLEYSSLYIDALQAAFAV